MKRRTTERMEKKTTESVPEYIKKRVHDLYWNGDVNCARTTLLILSELYEIPLEAQTLQAAAGLLGAGGYRAQCGLVEGSILFLGIYCGVRGKSEKETVDVIYRYAAAFETHFGSLRCRELRPGGFTPQDPPHLCEKLSCEAVEFIWNYIQKLES